MRRSHEPQQTSTGVLPVDDVAGFLSWFRQQQLMLQGKQANSEAFGNIVWDPGARIWRHYYHNNCNNTTGTIYMMTSRDGRLFENPVQVLAAAGGEVWDSTSVGVPFVWHEPGTARPWRMVYRGTTAANNAQIGMATSLDGITWARTNVAGTALTDPIIDRGAVSVDFGNVFYDSVTGLYFLYWNTIGYPRTIYLSTSPDLITWTLYADGAAVFSSVENAEGGWDYDDATHDSVQANATFGYYCGFYGRYDLPDGTPRYLAILSTTVAPAGVGRAAFTVWTSTSPYMIKANRTYIGQFLLTAAGVECEGLQFTALDTPAIVCDDITQDVRRSIITGNELWCSYTPVDAYHSYTTELMTRRRDISIASLSGIDLNFPTERPVIRLAPRGDANTVGLWLPEITGSLRDLSGNGDHLRNAGGTFTAGGLHLTAASAQYAIRYHGALDAVFAALNAVTGDFCIEIDATADSLPDVNAEQMHLFVAGKSSSLHFNVFINYENSPYFLRIWLFGKGIGEYATASANNIAWGAGQRHLITICRSESTMYFFLDGVAVGTANKPLAITPAALPVFTLLGVDSELSAAKHFDGTIHAVRCSNAARYTAAYTPTPLTHGYATTGTLFSTVYDMGSIGAQAVFATPGAAVPTGTALTLYSRVADNINDVSSNIAAFTTLPNSSRGRYRQFALVMTGPGTATPSVPHVVIGRKP